MTDNSSTKASAAQTPLDQLANVTVYRYSSRTFGPATTVSNYVLLTVSIAIVVSDIIAVRVLRKCRRIPRQCLLLSVNFIVSDCVNSALFALHQIALLMFNFYNDITHFSRMFGTGLMNNITSASITAITVERVIALKANLRYAKSIRMRIFMCVIVFVWVFHTTVIASTITVGVGLHCNWDIEHCDLWVATTLARLVMVGVMIAYDIVLCILNTVIYRIARKHAEQINALKRSVFADKVENPDTISERQHATTRAVISIVAAYLILQIPITVHNFISDSHDTIRHELWMRIYLCIGYLGLQMHTFVNLYLFVGKFQECKMHFYFMIGRCFKSFERKAELLRLQVYNIVVSTESDKAHCSTDV